MKTLSGAAAAALALPEVGTIQLVRLGFSPTPIALAASTYSLPYGGDTYRAAQGLGNISPVEDSPGEVRGMQFEITGAPAEYISLAMDGSDDFQGVPISIATALINSATGAVADVLTDWVGTGDTFTHQIQGQAAAIVATAESSEVDLQRGNPLTYSDADQQILFSGDRAFEFVVSDADKRDVWPTREFFFR